MDGAAVGAEVEHSLRYHNESNVSNPLNIYWRVVSRVCGLLAYWLTRHMLARLVLFIQRHLCCDSRLLPAPPVHSLCSKKARRDGKMAHRIGELVAATSVTGKRQTAAHINIRTTDTPPHSHSRFTNHPPSQCVAAPRPDRRCKRCPSSLHSPLLQQQPTEGAMQSIASLVTLPPPLHAVPLFAYLSLLTDRRFRLGQLGLVLQQHVSVHTQPRTR